MLPYRKAWQTVGPPRLLGEVAAEPAGSDEGPIPIGFLPDGSSNVRLLRLDVRGVPAKGRAKITKEV